jgi:hypothetical protein
MRHSPYTYDILCFLHHLKINFPNTIIIVYFDKNLLHREDQGWINHEIHQYLLKNIIIDSIALYGFKSFHVIDENETLNKILEMYGKRIIQNDELFPHDLKNKIHSHYSIRLVFKNPQKINLKINQTDIFNFKNWKDQNKVKEYVLLQVRSKSKDSEGKAALDPILIREIINFYKKKHITVIIMPDYYNRFISFKNAITYSEGSISMSSRIPAYLGSELNISLDQIGPFMVTIGFKNSCLIIFSKGQEAISDFKQNNYLNVTPKINTSSDITPNKKILFMENNSKTDLLLETLSKFNTQN